MAKFAWLSKVTTWGKKALPGVGAFFGLEWLTSGGLQDAGSGALGVQGWAVSIVMIIGAIVVALIVIEAVRGRSTSRSGSRGRR